MTHRAGQIVDAVASLVGARVTPTGIKVFTHRRLSLAADEDHLPAISIDFGEDQRAETKLMGSISSVLSVVCTAVVTAPLEQDIRLSLLSMRREIHRALMADARLGLGDFVVNTLYGGAAEPEILTDGESIVGVLASTWLVSYQMNTLDPGDD
jgi:hypothetical protein